MWYGERSTPTPSMPYRSASRMMNSPFPVAISSTCASRFSRTRATSWSSFSRLDGLQTMCSRCVMSKNFHMSMKESPLLSGKSVPTDHDGLPAEEPDRHLQQEYVNSGCPQRHANGSQRAKPYYSRHLDRDQGEHRQYYQHRPVLSALGILGPG